MSSTGIGSGFLALWGFHVLAVIAFLSGVLFLLFWAFKTLTTEQLKKWGWSLIIGGALVCLITIGAMGHTWSGMGNQRFMTQKGESCEMMNMMGAEKSGMMKMGYDNDDAMGMSMKGMSMMLEGKTGDAFDEAFIEMMIPHHQGAIDMAELAEKNAGHAEIKKMSADILSAQQREIDQMKAWQSSWGFTE